jgi:hypothetical protein
VGDSHFPARQAFVRRSSLTLAALSAVALFAERLGVSPAELLDPVKHELAGLYTAGDASNGDALSRP